MAEALVSISTDTLLIVGVTALIIAAIIWRNARRSVELAEGQMEDLREEQARLAFLDKEHQGVKEELKKEREQRLEARRRAERLIQERLLVQRDRDQLTEELKREREQRQESQRECLQRRQEQERLAGELEQEREKRLEAQQRARQEHEGRLRNAQRFVELAEDRIEYLREERVRLALLQEERRDLEEELKKERERRLEAQQKAERVERMHRAGFGREHNELIEELEWERAQRREAQQKVEQLSQERLQLRRKHERLAEELEREREQRLELQHSTRYEHEEREQERRARLNAEHRADLLARKLQVFREDHQESSSPVLKEASEELSETRDLLEEKTRPAQEAQKVRRPTGFPETRAPETSPSELGEGGSGGEKPRFGVWVPHPDANANQAKMPAEQARAQSDTSIKMDHKHYDKYLENYRGYVELAEKLYQTRSNGEVPPGSPAERKWEESLRRVSEGIKRTTAKLDALEERNPELATDDRISRRASIARRQSKLEKQVGL